MKRLEINILICTLLLGILGSCTSPTKLSLDELLELGSGRNVMFQDLQSTSVQPDSICGVYLTASYNPENLDECFEALYGLPNLQMIVTSDDDISDELLEGIDYAQLSTVRFIYFENSRVTQKMIDNMAAMPNLESITMRNGMGISSLPAQLIQNKKFKSLNLGICLDKPDLISSDFEPITTVTSDRKDINWAKPLPWSMRHSYPGQPELAIPSQVLLLNLRTKANGRYKEHPFNLKNYSNTMVLRIERGFPFMDSIDFASLNHLKKVVIEDFAFNTSDLRALLESNPNLTSVTFNAIGVDSIPECICLQRNIKRLQIKQYSDSLVVPPCFKELELEYLVLDNVSSIDPLVNHKVKHLKMVVYADQLDLSSLNEFTAAKSLDLELRGHDALREEIELNGVEQLPFDIGQLKQLEDLRIVYRANALELVFPEQDCNLSQLRYVEIQCKLESFPPFLNENSTKLKEVALENTGVTELPAAVGKWNQLKALEITGHRISNLPAELGQLNSLEYLLLPAGMLQTIDTDFRGMDSLRIVDLVGNDLTIDELKKVASEKHRSYLSTGSPNEPKRHKMLTDELPGLLNAHGYENAMSAKKEYYRPFWRRAWLDPYLHFEML